jgi:hypothetical protein
MLNYKKTMNIQIKDSQSVETKIFILSIQGYRFLIQDEFKFLLTF